MLRLVGFFVVAIVLANLLGHLPIIGGFFRSTGLIGVWVTAILLALALTRWGERAVRVRRESVEVRQLEAVDSPHNRGKLGSLLLARGSARKALPHLEAAAAGEPGDAEWGYRLGCARLSLGDANGALAPFEAALAVAPEHAYGAARMRLAEAHARLGAHDAALDALESFVRDHGPSAEQAYRRGVALRALGRRDEARASFKDAVRHGSDAAKYQRREATMWAVRARIAALR